MKQEEQKKEDQVSGKEKIKTKELEKVPKTTDKKTVPVEEKELKSTKKVKEENPKKEEVVEDKAKKETVKEKNAKEDKPKEEKPKKEKPVKTKIEEPVKIDEASPEEVLKTEVKIPKEPEKEDKGKEQPITEISKETPKKTTVKESPKEEIEKKKPMEGEFDWDLYEQDEVEYDETERKELEEKYTSTLSVIVEMEVINAKVVNITDKDVVLNIGFKSDGLVPLAEFKHKLDLKVGDEVEVLVESTEGPDGQIILSHKKARAEGAWNKILKAHESGEILIGHIKDRTKGGMVVDMLGLDAFLPGSQLDIKPVQDYDSYVGKDMELKVVKLNPAFRNIVVSHKAIIEQDIEQQRHKILSKLEKGQVLEGIVKNLTSFGVFVDLGGVDGLIHITDVSWGRINHPNELVEIGQKINVVVLDYDEEKNRISLGMKQLTQHPWETLPKDIVEGMNTKGKVVNIEDYGAFIEIYPGVEGLVHVSEMTWSQHLKSPAEYLKLNDQVDVKVLSISREERKLSLGVKQLTEDPWIKINDKFPKGSTHEAIIKNITNFGLFLELEEGIDGLVHISDLSWTKKYNHPSEFAKVGDNIKFIILEIDQENRRVSLGHKQLEEDPWSTFKDIFATESIHEGSIAKLEDKGGIITLPYNVEGFCPNKHLIKEDNSKPVIDEVLEFKVIEFNRSNRKIIVSHILVWKDSQKEQKDDSRAKKKKSTDKTRKAISHVRSKVMKSTLASELDILQEIKDKMIADQNEVKSPPASVEKKEDQLKPKKETGKKEDKKKMTITESVADEKKEPKTPPKKTTKTAAKDEKKETKKDLKSEDKKEKSKNKKAE